MKAAIVGGRLQGTEAAFLAREAGWETVLIDRDPNPPAARLSSSFHRCDVISDGPTFARLLKGVDLIVPATENVATLRALQSVAAGANKPLAFDAAAYHVTHSKRRSNRLFEKLGVPVPRKWPECRLPLFAKPSASSGSRGVLKLDTQEELDSFLRRVGANLDGWVLEEYLEGPSYSIEVVGVPGDYEAVQITEIIVDDGYDCNRVLAPAEVPEFVENWIRDLALRIAASIRLKGIMDVEFILNGGVPKVLEIDARLPSQTPTAVYESTGINMLELLGEVFINGRMPHVPRVASPKGVVYEHVRASSSGLEFSGEHIMGCASSLEVVPGFFGADVAVSNSASSRLPWVATLIMTAPSLRQAWLKREQVVGNIRRQLVQGADSPRRRVPASAIAS